MTKQPPGNTVPCVQHLNPLFRQQQQLNLGSPGCKTLSSPVQNQPVPRPNYRAFPCYLSQRQLVPATSRLSVQMHSPSEQRVTVVHLHQGAGEQTAIGGVESGPLAWDIPSFMVCSAPGSQCSPESGWSKHTSSSAWLQKPHISSFAYHQPLN